jgi:hypothetical protein
VNHSDASTVCRSREEIRHFLRWCWAALGWDVVQDDAGIEWLRVPDEFRHRLGDCEAIPIADGAQAGAPSSVSELPQPPSPPDLLRMLGSLDRAAHAAPACQPTSVHELAPRLFDAYTVEGGRVMLGGCSLEDHPLIRITGSLPIGDGESVVQFVHHFTTIEGQPVDPRLLDSLHVDRLTPLRRAPRPMSAELTARVSAARKTLADFAPGEPVESVIATVVWCKYFRCKLTFEIGEARAELPLGGWAQWLIDGEVKPPPLRCPHTGHESFHVLCTDDGIITVPEAVAVCEHSGRRVLASSLALCECTGRRVLREFLASCPVSGQTLLACEMAACAVCGQQVSPQAIAGQQCQACRDLRAVRRDDPRMARVFGEHPKLEQWSRWRLSETATVYILRGSSFFRRLLVVLDRESLDPLRLAEGTFLSRRWSAIAPELWHEYLS